jgi:plasmid stabilization system protein ParE
MAELRLTPEANADLEDITVYRLDQFGRATADRYLSAFESAFEILERYPESGAVYAGIVPDVRWTRCGSHRSAGCSMDALR